MNLIVALAMMAAQPVVSQQQDAPPQAEEAVDWDKEFGAEKRVPDPVTGELPVAPYTPSGANAGTEPFKGDAMARAFGGQDGIRSIVARLVELSNTDPRIEAIFQNHDMVRLRRTLFEQICFILNAGCNYTGRDMKASHKGMGIARADMNALVENLQRAMREQGVPFAAQNRLLAKLAPMDRHIQER
ncbi:MAG: group I truncated hemoglobin [Novosphingobium sp.]